MLYLIYAVCPPFYPRFRCDSPKVAPAPQIGASLPGRPLDCRAPGRPARPCSRSPNSPVDDFQVPATTSSSTSTSIHPSRIVHLSPSGPYCRPSGFLVSGQAVAPCVDRSPVSFGLPVGHSDDHHVSVAWLAPVVLNFDFETRTSKPERLHRCHPFKSHGAPKYTLAMSSRPPLAVSQRQSQRSLAGPGLSQRPAHQRTLSQQYLPQSPVRRSDGFHEQVIDGGDVSQPRFGTTPRRGGSRLKLELANDGIDHSGFTESPQNLDPFSASKTLTPSRVMFVCEAPDSGDSNSSQTLKCRTVDGDSAPMPMPPRRARFKVPTSAPPPSYTPTPVKKDAKPKPFVLETPITAPRYSITGRTEPSGEDITCDP